ncbi:ent-kaur-16-ene synthase, chloroplastic-like isoform X1 [Zingiber officinale]|uniref:ent-kaur-16-ene synthase, chloroplastic-like isoform X1 n=1 Tax=Zingiber officinale TaxID=94328 RepID=UPI001C4B497B|nr:ent-kaur-16-ene synthase, chloroplastic-like isoform X1 [Zingiber officinale]
MSPSLQIMHSVIAVAPKYTLTDLGCKMHRSGNKTYMCQGGSIERISRQFQNVQLSASSYDTAWVAMVPSPTSPNHPSFPQFLDWIIKHQHSDGSWRLNHFQPFLIKDYLSTTLACIIALERWKVGQEQVRKGLNFIRSNFSSILDERLQSPIGFDIVFPSMLKYAIDIGLDVPIEHHEIDNMLRRQNAELHREQGSCNARETYLAYVAEGLGNLHDWKETMKHQLKNGSLFNSAATTAAAMMHHYDSKAHEYLHSLRLKFHSLVPTLYAMDVHTHLHLIDTIEKLGIAEHFRHEIKNILDKTYRSWLLEEEEIHSDVATCAMAFRLLRLNGYDVSSDCLSWLVDEDYFSNALQGYKDVNTVLELYKASQIKIFPNEQGLDKLASWSRMFLKEVLSTNRNLGHQIDLKEVDYALKFPIWSNVERLEHKSTIENFTHGNSHALKTSCERYSIKDSDLVRLALDSFRTSQRTYQEELQILDNWVQDSKLDQLEFARQKQTFCYFSAAAILFSPGMSDARISYAKSSVLATVVDDFFDNGESVEELQDLISLVEKWDANWEKETHSEQVNIIFSALFHTINELGTKASILQKRAITHHLVEAWLRLMNCMMKEAECRITKEVPSLDEYMKNGFVSFALEPVILPALYFLVPELPEGAFRNTEYENLFRLVSICGRLLNDVQGFQRECEEGKVNAVSLRVLHSAGSTSEEEAKQQIQGEIESARTELLRMVVQQEGSVVPRPCKDLFWKTCKILHLFYMNNDGFTSPKEMVRTVDAVIHEPIKTKLKSPWLRSLFIHINI